MAIGERESKWWAALASDILLFLSFLFVYLSLPLPHFSISHESQYGDGTIIYGWQTARIWGWTFPHTVFFFAFLLQKNHPETLLRVYLFAELLFGMLFITTSPTITTQHVVGQSDIEGVEIHNLRGAYLLFTAYILGAVVALLHLFLTVRAIENDRVGEHSFGVNVAGPYQLQSTPLVGGYQSLADATPVSHQNQHLNYHHQPTSYTPITSPSGYAPVSSAPIPTYSTSTNPNAPYQSGSPSKDEVAV